MATTSGSSGYDGTKAALDSELTVDVVIIGSGISGMTVAIDMIRQGNGRNFVILEKGQRVGGTWSDNEYPGCCCDVWSHLYSLSFSPNPDWSREYPTQPEIQRYLTSVAHKYDLEKNIRFQTTVTGSSFDRSSGFWTTTTAGSPNGGLQTFKSRFLVSAVGQLSQPALPSVQGLDEFQGKVMHSAQWDKAYALQDKTIGVIGNGATAAQIVPEVAKVAKKVVVFQRSANWVTPRDDTDISSLRRAAYRYVPFVRRLYRGRLMDIREATWPVLSDTESIAHQGVKALTQMMLERDLPGDERAELRAALTPDYPPGCKRLLICDDYYPALAQPHVTLETASIIEATSTGLSVNKGWNSAAGEHDNLHYDFDLLVCATGFKATKFLSTLNISVPGDAKSLGKQWEEHGAQAYLGMTVPGVPNFAMLYGPNTNLGHNSIILMIEAQSAYINRLIRSVREYSTSRTPGDYLYLQPRADVSQAWNEKLQARLGESTLASPLCTSWYKTVDGKITNNWSENVVEYQKLVSSVDWNDYELRGPGSDELRARGKTSWTRVKEESQTSEKLLALGSTIGLLAVAAMVGRRYISLF